MKEMIKMIVILSILLIGITAIFPGSLSGQGEESELAKPFGFERGMTYEDLKEIDPTIRHHEDDQYIVGSAPIPHHKFDYFTVRIHETEGLYYIQAINSNIKTCRYGTRLKSEFNEIVEGIKATYGEPTDSDDFLRSGSIWDEPRDWMMAMVKKERIIYTEWEGKNLKNKGLEMIRVIPAATSSRIGFVAIDYCFKGHEQLREEGKEKPQY